MMGNLYKYSYRWTPLSYLNSIQGHGADPYLFCHLLKGPSYRFTFISDF